ncbi:hypothetical protein GCM10009624_34590 [Gordonia sinesedis]
MSTPDQPATPDNSESANSDTAPDLAEPVGEISSDTAPDLAEPVGEIVDADLVPSVTPGPTENPTVTVPSDYTDSGVPTFDYVRDKIEHRINTAVGSQELAESTPEGRGVDEMMRKRDEAAKRKLDEIRKSMGSDG